MLSHFFKFVRATPRKIMRAEGIRGTFFLLAPYIVPSPGTYEQRKAHTGLTQQRQEIPDSLTDQGNRYIAFKSRMFHA